MDLEIIILSEQSQMEKANIMISLTCGILKKKKKIQMNLFAEQKRTQRLCEQTMVPEEDRCQERWTEGLGPSQAHCGTWNGWPTGTCCTAQGTLLNIL